MKNNHLTDETLQAFLLKEIQDHTIAIHLAECSTCRKRLEEYQYLIDSMQKIKTQTFSFDVTSLVMEKIIDVEAQKEKNTNILLYMSLSIVSIVALGLLSPYIKIIFTQFKSFSIMANVFMFFSVLGVIVFLVDDLFRQYKQKEKLFSQ
jgi:predicted anti-sigma-YlaC factor YlaD